MDFAQILRECSDDWVFNSIGIENFNSTTRSRLRHWFDHVRMKHDEISGDIFEFGVYKGGGAIAMGILLKMLGSDKTVYAFDSFSGFPNYHKNDSLDMFDERQDLFSRKHREEANLCRKIAEWRLSDKVNPSNISTSGDFSDVTRAYLEDKIAAFGLDNIVLIEGSFSETLPKFFQQYTGSVFSANIDCDLYEGYRVCLENIYHKCQSGSFIYLDEYYSLKFPGARIAVCEFMADKVETAKLLSDNQNDFERWAIVKE